MIIPCYNASNIGMKPIIVYVYCRDKEEAEDIGRQLLKKRLVACVNIISSPIQSFFFWPPKQNFIEEASETLLLAKTFDDKWDDVEKTVKKMHLYDTPGIMAVLITHISKKYLAWMKKELYVKV